MSDTEKTEETAGPQKAGQYYILEKIAQGGMAEIYKGLAYDLAGIKKTVCIKKILPNIAASREFIDMLVNEAKIAVKLNHGNIAQIYDLGKAGEDYFIVMEYVEGQTLSKLHKKVLRLGKKIPLPIACYLISEIANGLNYMHRKTDEDGHSLHIVHRDISPQNIMVSYSGTVKIIDFGIAKAAVKVGHTESGILKGKFAYMSPEQARGDTLDHRSDIFSLGVILYELLTGKRLFKGTDNKQTLRNVRKTKVVPPSEVNPDLSKQIDTLVLKSLSKDRRHRYLFASDFHEELQKFLHTHFPDFKSSQVAEYMQSAFQDELVLNRKLNTEGNATPHLILDKTETAHIDELSEKTSRKSAGINWREFMIDAEWPETKDLKEESPVAEESESESESEHTEEKKVEATPSFVKQAVSWGAGLVVFFSLSLAGYFYYRTMDHGPVTIDYGPWTMDHGPKTTQETITIQKEELKLASVTIESNPSGASVYLDENEIGQTTPAQLLNLQPGEKHTLGLYLTNYKFFKTDFETQAGETQKFHVELAMDYGSLKVISEPPGGSIFLNGQLTGTTPLLKSDLAPGALIKVEVQLTGFYPYSEDLQIAAGREHLVHINLDRLPSLPVPKTAPIMNPEHEQNQDTGTTH
ncbi:MAG: serine/threonine protein kinase [Deltaproteobacteria bacterium]|nr:serine/threonine protein kinase [Deltaproteobacteria bacterium]